MPRCFQIHSNDNVATMLDDAAVGQVEIIGAVDGAREIELKEAIRLGHKIALTDIPAGKEIVKFGVAIGVASAPIGSGHWVHMHNCRSQVDEHSGRLDNETGVPSDTSYT